MTNQIEKTQYITVSALVNYIHQKFVRDPYLEQVFVQGEVTNYHRRSTKHQYFSLKDENDAIINAVMFASSYSRLNFELEPGMKVYATGRVQTYAERSTYQIIVTHLEPDGIGALYLAYEQLKEKLQKEGLFDRPKLPIPAFPKHVAVITSPTGSVIRDIVSIIRQRNPLVKVTLFPAIVQGESSVPSLIKALNSVSQRADEFDALIIGRGGGSIEELWSFNDEQLARAITEIQLPVISSVGHETDVTIADFVADLRAETPTAAAMAVTPLTIVDTKAGLNDLNARLFRRIQEILNHKNTYYEQYKNHPVLKYPKDIYQPYMQRFDLLYDQFVQLFRHQLSTKQQQMDLLNQRLYHQHPSRQLNQAKELLQPLNERFSMSMTSFIKQKEQHLHQQMQLLDAHSPLNVLQRGYAIVQNNEQQAITTVEQVKLGETLDVRLAQGSLSVQVNETKKESKDE